jgi:hypothetical protein
VLGGVAAVVALALSRVSPGVSGPIGTLLVGIVVLLPIGALLGMVLPLGIRASGAPDARLVAAAVAVHGAGAAAGLAMLTAVAMRSGMSGVVATATIAYGAAAACLVARPRRAVPEPQAVPSVAVGS